LGLPDLDHSIAAYQSGRREYYQVDYWDTCSGNFIPHILWTRVYHLGGPGIPPRYARQ
jgi:hypothetical protein